MAGSSGGGRSGGKSGGKSGTSSRASNAALHDDDDIMAKRKANFAQWKQKRRPNQMIDYANSPAPPGRKR